MEIPFSIPEIRSFMTPSPVSIEADDTLTSARRLMAANEIRHLPVVQCGRLVGMLSDRDLRSAAAIECRTELQFSALDFANTDVYAVSPDTPLDKVLNEMALRKLGAVVVEQQGTVVGICTSVDLCRHLGVLLAHLAEFGPKRLSEIKWGGHYVG